MNDTPVPAPALPPVLSVLPSREALTVLEEITKARATRTAHGQRMVDLGNVSAMSLEDFDDLVAVADYRARTASGKDAKTYSLGQARTILGLPPG